MKLNKKDLRELRKLAAQLPPTWQEVNKKKVVKGSDIASKDHYAHLREELIQSDEDLSKRFLLQSSSFIPVSHYRRLKRIMIKQGEKSAKNYIDGVISIFKGHQNMMDAVNRLPEENARQLAGSALVCLKTLS